MGFIFDFRQVIWRIFKYKKYILNYSLSGNCIGQIITWIQNKCKVQLPSINLIMILLIRANTYICFIMSQVIQVLYMLCCAQLLSRVRLFVTPWTAALQAPLSMGILQARILEQVAMPSFRGSSQPRDRTLGLPHCRWILYHLSHQGSPRNLE